MVVVMGVVLVVVVKWAREHALKKHNIYHRQANS